MLVKNVQELIKFNKYMTIYININLFKCLSSKVQSLSKSVDDIPNYSN